MGHPLRRVHTHVVLLDCDTELLKGLFSLVLNLLRALHLLLPGLVQALHKLLARLQLVLQLCLRDRLDRPILRLVRNFLLRCWDSWVEDSLGACTGNPCCWFKN